MHPSIAPAPAAVSSTNGISISHIGIIAGEGQFPFLLARAARERGISTSAICIRGITSEELPAEVDQHFWLEFGQFNKMIQTLKQAGVTKAVMAGRIKHSSIFQLSKIDLRGLKLLAKAPTKRADSLLGAITAELAHENIEVLDSTLLIQECIAKPGLLTPTCAPARAIMQDIEFGKPLATQLAGLDVGQTLIVKQQSIVAVEAMEGTDKCILRAGEEAGPGCVVIKVAKPRQDKRFDMPELG